MTFTLISIPNLIKFRNCISVILIFLAINPCFSQSAHKFRIEGDRSFEKQDFSSSEVYYKKALEKENDFKANYNLGNSLISQNRTGEAIEAYKNAINSKKDKITESKAQHNIGNAYYKMDDYTNSIDSYKKSLRLNPNDNETRKNLALAKEKFAEKNKKNINKNNNDQEKKNNNKDKNNQENSENKNQNKQEKQTQSGLNDNKMSKNEIDKLLKNIESDENEIQKRVFKGKRKSEKRKKDW